MKNIKAKNLKRIMVRDGMMRGRGLMMRDRGFIFIFHLEGYYDLYTVHFVERQINWRKL